MIHSLQFIHSLVFSPRGRSGRNQSPVMEPMWLLALHPKHILGDSLPLLFPAFRGSHFRHHVPLRSSSERWNCGRERCPVVILPKFLLPRKFRDLLHAANLRHGTVGFTSPPKEVKPTVSAGFEPANLGTKGQHATSRPPKP